MRLVMEEMCADIPMVASVREEVAPIQFACAEAERSLRMFLRLDKQADLFLEHGWSPEEIFWSRYYWFLRFVRLQARLFGYNVGLEQQAFQILEYPSPCEEVDWRHGEQVERLVAESIDTEARQASMLENDRQSPLRTGRCEP